MADPDWNPDTAGRPLAEILREAGIDTSRAARRRRWDDPDDTGIRQRRPDDPGGSEDPRAGYGRRSSDQVGSDTGRSRGARPAGADRGAVSDTGRSRMSDTGRSRGPGTGRSRRVDPGGSAVSDTGRNRAPDAGRDRSSDTGRSRAPDSGRAAGLAADPSTAAIPGLRPSQRPEVPGAGTGPAGRRGADEPAAVGVRTGKRPPPGEDFSTGPIPVVRDGDPVLDADEDVSPRESALAWLRFAGELVIALAAGVGVYFLATVLWEQLPQVAVLLTPLAVTGLVAGVSLWRQRLGREPVSARLLAVLVFAGVLLTVAPAAQLLAAR